MVVGVKTAAVGVSAVGMVTLLSGMAVHFRNRRSVDNELMPLMADSGGAVPGRIVSIPVQDYKMAFKATLKLGQCPLVMEGSNIKKWKRVPIFSSKAVLKILIDNWSSISLKYCSEKTAYLAKIQLKESIVDVTRAKSSEDIVEHIMGGVGGSVGVLGLVSVSVKLKVAVTTNTKKENMNLISSYEMLKGVVSLHGAKPKTVITEEGALFLSEIEIGGHETLLVTLEFKSEEQKVEVEYTVTFKILFWSISAKIKFVHTTFKSQAAVRIQFRSSWRPEIDANYDNLGLALPKVEQAEASYMEGPRLLRDLSNDDERTHNFYYFSSWKVSPYGNNFNLALINHDLDFLSDQNTEMKSVLHRINQLKDQSWTPDKRQQLNNLNTTLTQKTTSLSDGLETYHKLNPEARQKLRDLYGVDKAPLYYTRELNTIIA